MVYNLIKIGSLNQIFVKNGNDAYNASLLQLGENMGEIVGYRRVSTTLQQLDRQLEGIKVDKMFDDYYSAKNTDRPNFTIMMQYLREGDTLLVHSLDRLARRMFDLQKIIDELVKRKVVVRFVKEGMEFSDNPQSAITQLMFNVLASFAEFERSFHLERVREGIAIAMAKGLYKGRGPRFKEDEINQIKRLLEDGVSVSKIARRFRVSRPTIYKYAKDTECKNQEISLNPSSQ